MVCPPLKCTCTPYLLHVFFTLLLGPWWYGTTMYKFWLLLLLGPFWFVVLLCLFLLGFWLFSFALFMAHVGYMHFFNALNRCCSSSCNNVWEVGREDQNLTRGIAQNIRIKIQTLTCGYSICHLAITSANHTQGSNYISHQWLFHLPLGIPSAKFKSIVAITSATGTIVPSATNV